jgi:hypothetical protein
MKRDKRLKRKRKRRYKLSGRNMPWNDPYKYIERRYAAYWSGDRLE